MSVRTLLLNRIARDTLARRFLATKPTPSNYCMNLVRQYDYENFLSTILLPLEQRAAGFAVRAFNVEVAQAVEQASDLKFAEMKLRFWSDALNDTYNGKPPQAPVALELNRILKKHKLSKYYFKRLIDARLESLYNVDFQNMAAMEKYAEQTFSSIYYLILESYGIKNMRADHIASHLGKAQGIATMVRSIPHNAKKRRNILPLDVLLKFGISTEMVLQQKITPNMQEAIYEVCCYSRSHIHKVNELLASAGRDVQVMCLPKYSINFYLTRLRSVDYDVFNPILQQGNFMYALILFWHRLVIH